MSVDIVKSLSAESGDTHYGEPSSCKLFASAWANTEDGRRDFESQFKIQNVTNYGETLTNALGEPLSTLIRFRWPSKKWLRAKRNELFAVVTDITLYNQSRGSEAVDVPATRGIQSTYIAEICERIDEYSIDEAETLTDEDVSAEEESGQPIDEGSEAALSSNFSALEAICVEVGKLRARPTPANESHWVPIVDQLITLAAQNFAWAFPDFVRGWVFGPVSHTVNT
ncbi:hypothetical protein B0H17DRAFT_138287 [Mycena rosella]|uniref:Uncharacterized protein n=1 Tax=Mycena rosella TaxID=1033263 RepID=A0AAD7GMZ4_MYCRO|nr:hypothetical protein B0H17DRAFT_138287 [Mycena rosella]